jgi:hypothetical protein
MASSFHLKSVSFFHNVSISTASFRAVATAALAKPRRPARRTVQHFQCRKFLHPTNQSARRFEQQASHGPVAAFRDMPGPIHLSGLLRSGSKTQKGSDVFGSPKPRGVIDQRNEIQGDGRADTGDGHQPTGDGMLRCFLLHGTFEVCSRLTKRGMHGNESVRDGLQHWIAFACGSELVAEDLPLPTFPDARQTDTEGLENSSDVAFEILAQADQLRSRTDQAS